MERRPVKYCVVDAFTDKPFMGNPAAVCLLEEEKNEKWMQLFAKEANAPVTCYLTQITNLETSNPRFRLRWFTRFGTKVYLCGHATLAAAHILFKSCLDNYNLVEFSTFSGILTARRVSDVKTSRISEMQNGKAEECFMIELDLPVVQVPDHSDIEFSSVSTILNGTGRVFDIRKAENDYLIIELSSWRDVVEFQPEFEKMKSYPASGIVITALASQNSKIDFHSRVFFPKSGIDEDFVCGSAHCALAHYWSKKLRKVDFVANSASSRGGIMEVHLDQLNQRVLLRGKSVKIMEGVILV